MIRQLLLWLMVAALLGACSSDKPPEPQPIAAIKDNQRVNISWNIDNLEQNQAGSFAPTILNNSIFTADHTGKILRIDDTDGSIIRKFSLKRELSSGTAVSSEAIFVTTSDAYLLSISRVDGSINWQVALSTLAIEPPQISGEQIVVVKTIDSELSAYDAKSGSLIWTTSKTNIPLTLRAYNTFQVIDNQVVLNGQPSGILSLINLFNGTVVWQNQIAQSKGATALDKLNDIGMRPVLKDKLVCVASFNGNITCIDAVSDTVAWSKNFSAEQGIVVGEQNVYAIDSNGVVFAFDKTTGAEVWRNKILQYRDLSMPMVLGANLIVFDDAGYINMFRRSDGKLIGREKSNLNSGIAYPIVDENRVIVQSGNGHLAKIVQ